MVDARSWLTVFLLLQPYASDLNPVKRVRCGVPVQEEPGDLAKGIIAQLAVITKSHFTQMRYRLD
ncbi:hypothetical protein LWC35_31445 [Pseudonocardia kujensis]|uniref:hypothetical protein n=1 Tax=Pseudonocardia kujensis TaxID=1128675 RepID=UPI001E475236|nr:hypothetical protein [Pseudonocardia kujensis]MCE0767382.1 hypothetical protein [Pseudonocardia kujensis]